jgi:hypothetical protein
MNFDFCDDDYEEHEEYIQCLLERYYRDRPYRYYFHKVCFLPKKFVNSLTEFDMVRIQEKDGTWLSWSIKEIYDNSEWFDTKKAIKRHRKNTGDSLPK